MSQCLERTCRCINEFSVLSDNMCPNDEELIFHNGREYQVDVYVSSYKVYQNGGYDDYVFLNEYKFNENFELIN